MDRRELGRRAKGHRRSFSPSSLVLLFRHSRRGQAGGRGVSYGDDKNRWSTFLERFPSTIVSTVAYPCPPESRVARAPAETVRMTLSEPLRPLVEGGTERRPHDAGVQFSPATLRRLQLRHWSYNVTTTTPTIGYRGGHNHRTNKTSPKAGRSHVWKRPQRAITCSGTRYNCWTESSEMFSKIY